MAPVRWGETRILGPRGCNSFAARRLELDVCRLGTQGPLSLPGEGQGEGELLQTLASKMAHLLSAPHPEPLPEGEGDCSRGPYRNLQNCR